MGAISTPYAEPGWLSPLLFAAGSGLSGLLNAVLLGRLGHRLRAPQARPGA
ncbi:hypothetical protein [Streptomyces sp. NPDC058307]|uniref:hypothetical protein n=1 Tax=Streptomyces sp. NPDC058307 TaxID=3346439 RepID=UPI0036E1EE3B